MGPEPGASGLASAETIDEFLAAWLRDRHLSPELQRVLEKHYGSYCRSFPPRLRRHYASQTQELAELVRAHPGSRLLEVGSGCGSESLWMAMRGARVVGIDVRADRVAVARARQALVEQELGHALACRFELKSLLDFASPAFDLVWMEQALHHLEPRREALDRLVELLVPGGHIVISEVNAMNPLVQLQLFLRRGTRTITRYVDESGRAHAYGNERVLRAATLERELARRGVRRVSLRHFRAFPNHPLLARLDGLEHFLASLGLAPLLTHYNFVGQLA